jgi:hypothetical protein
MSIQSVTEVTKAPAAPVSVVASGAVAAAPAQAEAEAHAVAPVETTPPPPPSPPPPPVSGWDDEIIIGEHQGSGHKIYAFVDPDTGSSVVQIPVEAVLNLVASILAKLEAEGRR